MGLTAKKLTSDQLEHCAAGWNKQPTSKHFDILQVENEHFLYEIFMIGEQTYWPPHIMTLYKAFVATSLLVHIVCPGVMKYCGNCHRWTAVSCAFVSLSIMSLVLWCTDRGGIQDSWISEAWSSWQDTADVGPVTLRAGQPRQRSKWCLENTLA